MQTVDKSWFQSKFADKKLTQRKVAKALGMDPATLSLLLAGKRRWHIDTATTLARLISVDVSEVIRRAGGVTEAAVHAGALPLVGWIEADGRAHVDLEGEPERRIEVAANVPADSVLLQWRVAGQGADLQDGWIAVTTPPQEVDPAAMFDRFCIVWLKDGRSYVRTVRRGYAPNTFTLLPALGNDAPVIDAEVDWFAPILMIIPN